MSLWSMSNVLLLQYIYFVELVQKLLRNCLQLHDSTFWTVRKTSLPQPAEFKLLGRKQQGKDKSGVFNAAMKANLGEPILAGWTGCSPCFLATVPILWGIPLNSLQYQGHSGSICLTISSSIFQYSIPFSLYSKTHDYQHFWFASLCFTFMELMRGFVKSTTSQQPSAKFSRLCFKEIFWQLRLNLWGLGYGQLRYQLSTGPGVLLTEFQDCQLLVLSASSRC